MIEEQPIIREIRLKAEKDEVRQIIKQAISEWLSEQFAAFGKWSAVGIASMAFASVVYVFMVVNGWIPPVHK